MVVVLLEVLVPMSALLNMDVRNTSVVERMVEAVAVMMALMNMLMLNILLVRHHRRGRK
jgi:hypothetical protein